MKTVGKYLVNFFVGGMILFCWSVQPNRAMAQIKAKDNNSNPTVYRKVENLKSLRIEKITRHLPVSLGKSEFVVSQKVPVSPNTLVTIMSEDFEGDFPTGLWQVSTGDYTWGKRSCNAHGGDYSAWVVGGGSSGSAFNCGANYTDNLEVWMLYGPFDLRDANWAAFSFFLLLDSEPYCDFFDFMASSDGETFHGYRLSGSTGDEWIPFSLSLTAVPLESNTFVNFVGDSTVWIAFIFSTDYSAHFYEGAFVDDVLLQKGMVKEPHVLTSFDSPGSSPRGLVYDGSFLWNADKHEDKIYKLSLSGENLFSFSSPGERPTGLAWDGSNFWNADYIADLIYQLSPNGIVQSSFPAPGGSGSGLAWDGTGLWYCDYSQPIIWKLGTDGTVMKTIPAPGTASSGITYDGQHLWIADQEKLLIYKIDTNGAVLDYFLTPSYLPAGLTFDDTHLWLADRYSDKIYQLDILRKQFANDVGVTSLDIPNYISVRDTIPICVEIKNFGTENQSNFPISYQIDNGAVVTENFEDTLLSMQSASKNFKVPWVPQSEGIYHLTVWTDLQNDESPSNDTLVNNNVIVSNQTLLYTFTEDFESYPPGVLAEASGSPWVQLEIGRNGNVSNYWVHSGQKNFQINSYLYDTEIDYVKFDLKQKPAQFNVELWYTPDGYYVYHDYAEVGLSYVASKFDMDAIAGFWGDDHDVWFMADGMTEKVKVFNELEYGKGPADMGQGTAKHNYIRAEFDFANNEVRFYIGMDPQAPLRSTVNFDGTLDFNALYIAGGLNPTYIDDIQVEAIGYTGVKAKQLPGIPSKFVLYQNYPNPFNPSTTIRFGVPKTVRTTIRVYDLLGRKVRTLTDHIYQPGSHSVVWNGKDEQGKLLPSGEYFVRMQAGEFVAVKKMLLLK